MKIVEQKFTDILDLKDMYLSKLLEGLGYSLLSRVKQEKDYCYAEYTWKHASNAYGGEWHIYSGLYKVMQAAREDAQSLGLLESYTKEFTVVLDERLGL